MNYALSVTPFNDIHRATLAVDVIKAVQFDDGHLLGLFNWWCPHRPPQVLVLMLMPNGELNLLHGDGMHEAQFHTALLPESPHQGHLKTIKSPGHLACKFYSKEHPLKGAMFQTNRVDFIEQSIHGEVIVHDEAGGEHWLPLSIHINVMGEYSLYSNAAFLGKSCRADG